MATILDYANWLADDAPTGVNKIVHDEVIDGGHNPHGFSRSHGICSNVVTVPRCVFALYEDPIYPFGGRRVYEREGNADTAHLNEARESFVFRYVFREFCRDWQAWIIKGAPERPAYPFTRSMGLCAAFRKWGADILINEYISALYFEGQAYPFSGDAEGMEARGQVFTSERLARTMHQNAERLEFVARIANAEIGPL